MSTLDEQDIRNNNRKALIEMIGLMGSFDPSKDNAAAGGYADGRYPDFYCEGGRLDIPFLPAGMKNFREGHDEHLADAEFRFRLFADFEWVGDFEVHDCLDPSTFILFAHSRAHTRSNVPYENHYVFFATMRDGKIAKLREYADTSRLMVLAKDIEAATNLL